MNRRLIKILVRGPGSQWIVIPAESTSIRGRTPSFFLFGPPGSGKSTWIRQGFPKALRLDLLDEALYQDLLVRQAGFADRIRHLPRRSWVCVDEAHRLPRCSTRCTA